MIESGPMKVLVTGANGQVGWELCRQAEEFGFVVLKTDYQELDITDAAAVAKFVAQEKPQIIINSAAYTAVDKAEEEQERAYAINALGPKNLAEAAHSAGIPLLHISTDYVFSGNKLTAYFEDDQPGPLGVYGETKLAGENYVQATLAQYVTLRTSWVFGIEGANFVKTMIRLGRERTELNVVADQKGNPTFAGDIAAALLKIAKRYESGQPITWGTYHFSGRGTTTWHGFAEAIFNEAISQGVLANRPRVNAITTAQYPTPAQRPINSELNCDRFIQTFPEIGQIDWQIGLSKLIESLKQ